MSDFGITVSSNNVSVGEASTSEVVLTSKYPLAKIDRNNKVSFQNIRIFFANEPPAPAVGTQTTITTFLYGFPHGYTYTPSYWAFSQAVGVFGQFSGDTTYFLDSGLIGGNNISAGAANATITIGVDATNCYIYINKFTGLLGPQIFVAGASLTSRIYIFAEDVSSTS